jgi:hypothetical protein
LGRLADTRMVVLLVDETRLQGRLQVMAVNLAYRARGMPLGWWCYRPTARLMS